MKRTYAVLGICLATVIAVVLTVVLALGNLSFEQLPPFDISLKKTEKVEKYILEVSASDGGSVNNPGGEYLPGSNIYLSASPDDGYFFAGWYDANECLLTLAGEYSFEITGDTVIYARFYANYKDISGDKEEKQFLQNTSTAFTFVVKCEKADAVEYITKNLKIVDNYFLGTEYEDAVKQEFIITKKENNEYVISLKDNTEYSKGATYSAILPTEKVEEINDEGETVIVEKPAEASIVVAGQEIANLTFSIEAEEKEDTSAQSGIRYLSDSNVISLNDDGLIDGDSGDKRDYIVLDSGTLLNVGDIFCVHSKENDEKDGKPILTADSLFGKVVEYSNVGKEHRFYYTMPELTEIYEDIRLSKTETLDLEKLGVKIDLKAIENSIRKGITSDEGAINTAFLFSSALGNISSAEDTVANIRSILESADVKVKCSLSGEKVKLNVTVVLSIPVNKDGVRAAGVSVIYSGQYETSYTVSTLLDYGYVEAVDLDVLRMNSGVSSLTEATSDYAVVFSSDISETDMEKIKAAVRTDFASLLGKGGLEKSLGYENAVKTLTKGKYSHNAGLNFDFLECSIDNFGGYRVTLRGSARIDLDIRGSLLGSDSYKVENNFGIIKNFSGVSTYENKSFSYLSSDFGTLGGAGLARTHITDTTFEVIGIAKYCNASLYESSGIAVTGNGFVSQNSAVYSGKMTVSGYVSNSASYRAFSSECSIGSESKKTAILSYGFDDAVLSYVNQSGMQSKTQNIIVGNEGYSLLDSSLISVNLLKTRTGITCVKKLGEVGQYLTVSVKTGASGYLTYNETDGMIKVTSSAPKYFEEDITISVSGKNNVWSPSDGHKEDAFVRLPSLTVHIVHGKEGDNDTPLQAAFRKLYVNYNSANGDIIRSEFALLVKNYISVWNSYKGVYEVVVNEYIDDLFGYISTLQKDSSANKANENMFTMDESAAFEEVFTLVDDLMHGQSQFVSNRVEKTLEIVLRSEPMYATITNAKIYCHPNLIYLGEMLQDGNPDARDECLTILDRFESKHADDPRALMLSKAFRTILCVD